MGGWGCARQVGSEGELCGKPSGLEVGMGRALGERAPRTEKDNAKGWGEEGKGGLCRLNAGHTALPGGGLDRRKHQ